MVLLQNNILCFSQPLPHIRSHLLQQISSQKKIFFSKFYKYITWNLNKRIDYEITSTLILDMVSSWIEIWELLKNYTQTKEEATAVVS